MEEKNIREILSAKRVVPEIQREYVWGLKDKIVIEFLTNLNNKVPGGANIGFLYDYECDNEFHLIDGQQRLTTIILLSLYCARKEGLDCEYNKVLNNFSYRVRTTTDEFLQGLFNTEITRFSIEGIKSLKIYHEIFKKDKSVEAIIKCFDIIDKFSKSTEFKITYNWILDSVSFWTFDVDQTSQGEELYISMNSRGADLTQAEQIKPLLLKNGKGSISVAGNSWGKEWDNWEDSLYCICKDVNGVNKAMDRLILIGLEIFTGELHSEIKPLTDASLISLSQLEQVHSAYCLLHSIHSDWMSGVFAQEFKESEKFRIEALIASVVAGHNDSEFNRVEHAVKNWSRQSLIKKSTKFIRFVHEYMTSGQTFYNFILGNYSQEGLFTDIFSHHELLKIKTYSLPEIGISAEKLFWEADSFYATGGYIRSIWQEAFTDDFEWTINELDTFKTRLLIFKEIFAEENIRRLTSKEYKSGEIDNKLIARALLALNNGAYDIWKSGRNYAFGHYGDWPHLLKTNKAYTLVSSLIDKIIKFKPKNTYDSIMDIIDEGKQLFKTDDVRYYILNYPQSISAEHEGYNIISMDDRDNWKNFNIYILDRLDARANYNHMFSSLVYKRIKDDFPNANKWLRLDDKEISIVCSHLGGWDIHYDKDYSGDIDILKKNLIKAFGERRVRDDEITKKNRNIYVSLLEDEDQVSLGENLYKFISGI